MKMPYMKYLIFAFAIINFGNVNGQSVLDCVPTLTPLNVDYSHSEFTRLALLNQITKSQFQEMRDGGDTSAEFPIYGVPSKFEGSWDEFNQARKEENRRFEYDFTQDQMRVGTFQYLTPGAHDAYSKCLESITKSSGIHIYPERIGGEAQIIHLKYVGGPEASEELRIDQTSLLVSGATVDGSFPIILKKGGSHGLIFNRDLDRDLAIVVNTDSGYDASLILPSNPAIKRYNRIPRGFVFPENKKPIVASAHSELVKKSGTYILTDKDIREGWVIDISTLRLQSYEALSTSRCTFGFNAVTQTLVSFWVQVNPTSDEGGKKVCEVSLVGELARWIEIKD